MRTGCAGGALVVALVAAACGGGGSGGNPSPPQPPRPSTVAEPGQSTVPPVATGGFESLGDVTLQVWSYDNQSPGLEDVLTQLSDRFTARYPNIRVKLRFTDFDTLMQTSARALAGDESPDVIEGSQGYRVDGAEVRAGLIVPLDRYVAAYRWDRWWGPELWSQVRFTSDGKTFGQGPIWGVGQAGQSVGLFYNRKKLEAAGLDPDAPPTSFAGFEQALATMRAATPAGEPVIELGNREGYGAIHVLGALQGVFADPAVSRGWVYHEPDATFETAANEASLAKLHEWAAAGYINRAYGSVGYDQAASLFADGIGTFFIGGTWEMPAIRQRLGGDAGMVNLPAGPTGLAATLGATSGPYHISARSRHPDVAAAWLDFVVGSPDAFDLLHKYHLTPAVTSAPLPDDPLEAQVATAWRQLDATGGLTPYPTWASFSMFQTMSRTLPEVISGRSQPDGAAKAIQADWQEFDDEMAAG